MSSKLKRGDQIVYIPSHAKPGKLDSIEFGFVTSISNDPKVVFCRYWSNICPGALRTTANSEGTNIRDLVKHNCVEQSVIDGIIENY